MSKRNAPSFDAELHTVSPLLVIALMLALAVEVTWEHDILPDPSKATDLALILYTLGLVALTLNVLFPLAGRWFTVLALTTLIELGYTWLRLPGFLALLGIPVALAAAIISVPAMIALAAGETALLIWLTGQAGSGVGEPELLVSLTAIWSMVGVMIAVYMPIRQLAGWSWEHFQRAQNLLDEARARRAELRQALEDLAHANRQLAFTNEKLTAARLTAEEAQKVKAAFVARVSHEFRTPLNMIIGLTDLLLESPEVYGDTLPPPLLEDLDIVHRNCEHLASMIDDVLSLSQIEAGRMALHKERVNLVELIDRAVPVVRPLLEKKHLQMKVQVPMDLPQVYCDRTRIRQVILNLLSNAARYTEEGQITIEARQEGPNVTISVHDTGPGIAPEEAEHIFEPFYQSPRTLRRKGEGSGLGLSISKQFVELHEGRMWLESQVGVGSTFSFRLPISPPLAPIAGPQRWLSEGWTWLERTQQANLPIGPLKQRLVICDQAGGLYSLFDHYAEDLEFVDTRDLGEAVAALQECPAQALVLNAPSAPELWQLMEAARAKVADTPLIGCSLPPQNEPALQAGALAYLPKPVTHTALREALQQVGRPVRRVLVVDDEADAVQLFSRMLHAHEATLEIATASTGKGALAAMHANRPDLVLLDIVLPDIDGWQLLGIKSQEEEIRDIPVIIVSAQDAREQPLLSPVLLVALGDGLPVSRLLRCSREIPRLLAHPA